MSKARRWVIIVLSLAVLVMIGINMTEKDDIAQVVVNNNDPTYKSEHTDTLVYNPEGALSYRLIAQHVEYYSDHVNVLKSLARKNGSSIDEKEDDLDLDFEIN